MKSFRHLFAICPLEFANFLYLAQSFESEKITFLHFWEIQKWPFLAKFVSFLVSRRSRWRPKDSRPYVRPSVRPCVTLLLENRSLLFSKTLQSVRACKCEKNVPSAFLKKIPVLPILAKNCPELVILAQKWRFFAICSLEFSNFLY